MEVNFENKYNFNFYLAIKFVCHLQKTRLLFHKTRLFTVECLHLILSSNVNIRFFLANTLELKI